MKKSVVYLFSIILVLGIISCGKDGGDGPLGPAGKQGTEGRQGIVGKQGIPGTDGKMLISGTGVPATGLGAEGDFYIDIANSNLYGPKTGTSWGKAASMIGATGAKGDKGATGAKGDTGGTGAKGDTGGTGAKGDTGGTGAKGTAGSQFLSGAAAPGATIGTIGDFYFNTAGGMLFGPKISSGWGTGVNLRGAKGEKGDKGDPGNANVYSTGWVKLNSAKFTNTTGGYRSPLDIASPFLTNSAFAIGSNVLDGVVLVYVRGLRLGLSFDIMLLPVMDKVTGEGKTGGIELRFTHSGDPNYAIWLNLSIGLQTGSWDANYMKNTYLPSLEWKVVRIPTMVAKANERGLSKIDMNSYQDVAKYFKLED